MVVGLRGERAALIRTGRTYAFLALAGAVLATVAMERALITRDFSLEFVANNGSTRTPALFNVATMWAALEGSILLWALVLAGYTALIAQKFRARLTDPLVGWALLTMLVVGIFFFGLMLGPANPFTTVSPVPLDGPGPNPLLQNHILMAFCSSGLGPRSEEHTSELQSLMRTSYAVFSLKQKKTLLKHKKLYN